MSFIFFGMPVGCGSMFPFMSFTLPQYDLPYEPDLILPCCCCPLPVDDTLICRLGVHEQLLWCVSCILALTICMDPISVCSFRLFREFASFAVDVRTSSP